MWCLSGQYSGSSGSCLLFVKPLVFLRGRRFFCFCSCEPFTTRPVFGGCMRPSFSSVWLISSATFLSLSLSLSLSGAGETQTPFGVWGSPCDSSTWTRTTSSTRTSSSPHTSRSPPAPVFFFFFASSSFVFGLVFSRFLSCRCWWSWWLFLSLVLVLVGWLHCLGFLFWPRGAFFFLLGWWGSPCRVFSSPCFLVLGGWVGDFCLLCILRLSLAAR